MAGRKPSPLRARRGISVRAGAKSGIAAQVKPVRRAAVGAATRARRAPQHRNGTKALSATSKRAPSDIGAVVLHADYNSHDVGQVKRFYTELLGFSDFSHEPEFDYLYVRTGPSSSLGFMPPLPGPPEQWRPPREPSICLIVEDVDRAHQRLLAKGVAFEQAPTDRPWGHRTAVLRDPEGRLLCLAQPIKRRARP